MFTYGMLIGGVFGIAGTLLAVKACREIKRTASDANTDSPDENYLHK